MPKILLQLADKSGGCAYNDGAGVRVLAHLAAVVQMTVARDSSREHDFARSPRGPDYARGFTRSKPARNRPQPEKCL